MIVFFDYLTTFLSTSDERYQACSGTLSSVKCKLFEGDPSNGYWLNRPRLEIYSDFATTEISSLSPLEIIIPVATVIDADTVNIKVATIGSSNEQLYLSATTIYPYLDKNSILFENFN